MPGKVKKKVTITKRVSLNEKEIENVLRNACGFGDDAVFFWEIDGPCIERVGIVTTTIEEWDPA